MTEYMYRYNEVLYANGMDEFYIPYFGYRVRVLLTEYPVLRYTPKGVWIDLGFGDHKFILLTAKKKFAHKTKKDALYSFIRRKQSQIKILKEKLDIAQKALDMGEKLSVDLGYNFEDKSSFKQKD